MQISFIFYIALVTVSPGRATETPDMLRAREKADLDRAKSTYRNYGIAKNLVLVVGDGMGVSTVTAGRIYAGQLAGRPGEEHKLVFEDFPAVALSKTYNLDRQVADSAGTATAMMCGVKVNYGTLGVNGYVPYGKNCSEYSADRTLTSVLDMALAEGKSVGLVTNTRITHATPAAAYAHTPYRYWESDTNMIGTPGCEEVKDIAHQLVTDNPDIHVILGGGRRSFINNTTPDPDTGTISRHQRTDGRDLRLEWQADKARRGLRYQYVENKTQLSDVDVSNTDYLFGLFSSGHMQYEGLKQNISEDHDPSLTDMVDKALKILKKNPKGFFLLVEGGRIDHAHHNNLGKLALVETVELDKAVKKIVAETSEKDTLITVTADHSHVFNMAGYPSRGHDILGTVDLVDESEGPDDSLPYLTLSYSNGPASGRLNYTGVDTTGVDFQQPGCVKMPYETHGGEDVAIYSRGPMSHLFHTTHEQSYIAHVMMYAACLGDYNTDLACDREERYHLTNPDLGSGIGLQPLSPILLVMTSLAVFLLHWLQ